MVIGSSVRGRLYDSALSMDTREACPSKSGRSANRTVRAAFLVLAATVAASCVYYEPVPVQRSGPSKFDRSWDAARWAAEDLGVTVTDVDRASGTIRGYRGATDVTISVWQQADGSVRVSFNVRGPSGPDTELAERLSHAFDRRME
jgi:hypothetical protein